MLTKIMLTDASHRLPLPGQPGAFLTGEGAFSVNLSDPFWAELLRDGSIIKAPEKAAPVPAPTKKEAR